MYRFNSTDIGLYSKQNKDIKKTNELYIILLLTVKEAEDIAFLSLGYLFKNNLTSVSNSSTKGQNKQPWKLWMIVNEFAFFRDLKQHIRNLLGIHFIKCYTLEIQEMWRKKSRGMNFKKNT